MLNQTDQDGNEKLEESNHDERMQKFVMTLGIYSVVMAIGVLIFTVCLERFLPVAKKDTPTTEQIERWAQTVSETAVTIRGLDPVESTCTASGMTVRCSVKAEGSSRRILTQCDFNTWLCNLVGFEPLTMETMSDDYDDVRSE